MAGQWVLTPGPFTFAQTPWIGTMHPLVLRSANQFKSAPPPELGSHRYARDLNEVKAYGRASGSARTSDQTATAYFWNANIYLFWRPITAIQHADIDGNPRTEADPAWTPLLTTPNHPEWPSAHGCATGAVTEFLADVLGTKRVDVTIWGAQSGATSLTTSRHFDTIDEIRDQIVDARVWIGFHYRSAVPAGLKLGEKVVNWDLRHAFRPLKGHDDD